MAKTGAKGKYEKWLLPENLVLVQGWRRDGLSDDQVSKNIGISRETLYQWLKKYADFADAYKKGTEVSTYEIENALYKSASGHYVEEIEIIETENDIGKTVTKKKHRRYIPPNTAAQIFILKNRRSDFWRDSRLIETKNEGQLASLIEGLKDSEKKDGDKE